MKLHQCLILFTSLSLISAEEDILDYIHGILGHKFNTITNSNSNTRSHTNIHRPHPDKQSDQLPYSGQGAHTTDRTYTTKPSQLPHSHHNKHLAYQPYSTNSYATKQPEEYSTPYTDNDADDTSDEHQTKYDISSRRPGYTGSRYRANDRGDTHLSITGTRGTWAKYLQNRKIKLSRYNAIKQLIRAYIKLHPYMIPRWVQLAFHDCSGARGCDGCMDRRHAGNHGLLNTIAHADEYHKEIAPELSRPDFYVLLGTEAAQAGSNYSLNIPYKTGRRDCYLDGVTDTLPAGDDPHAFEFLMDQFRLTVNETISLLGAHSLGAAHKVHSGFHGPWDLTPLKLDNGYYKAMRADLDWELEQLENKTTGFKSSQWTSKKLVQGKSFLMLHTDMALKYEFDCNGDYKMPTCDRYTCQTNESRFKVVKEFADSLELFYEYFSRAFTKMTSKGTFSLYAPIGQNNY